MSSKSYGTNVSTSFSNGQRDGATLEIQDDGRACTKRVTSPRRFKDVRARRSSALAFSALVGCRARWNSRFTTVPLAKQIFGACVCRFKHGIGKRTRRIDGPSRLRKSRHLRLRHMCQDDANAADERATQQRQTKAVTHTLKEENRLSESMLSREANRMKRHFLLLKHDQQVGYAMAPLATIAPIPTSIMIKAGIRRLLSYAISKK